ncbi:16S rRNA (guanine(966)-N(2))-methyltransferase RsmD [Corynebacterium striatum]|uniref:16S rRNA (guanine(966)-N(2))-methyltransferase RsmD n=1 Tax=Corynebacterium striatum TaxID=43770 RepID=UPI000C1CCB33|nr:16S rRNA (guanine(966)-N(2))-methyltransferase RsmD [Corynebacterium striatum]PIS60106.1 16S rRNA (guanine(966)-N(2))-methyltransferase RsmD [Corynebacterium striatum]PIS60760.1 16S rRNA (guanine(966)-N(2))-methyltransferase RsmD [Corynebacterium striatum]PIS63828.1 16S rRNA (guanine(966)-N(2))-methyltransferase RsmD [Corynebacterium striatum]PIS65430.1 16S rRNA (guanine(966)-N(2))-methyltransferase RsmD [Corynebacterium striatum]PXY05214.1 16S rRNA (guanine(966)-N(2))-methyltransferase Rsm
MTRIIAGEARGRSIKVPESGTRPTSDRAREGLFSSLNVRWGFADSRVLDLFAGSGALGLEAASRGAEEVVLVESSPAAVKVIQHNMGVVKHPRVTVRAMKASTYLASAPRKYFDMVLADPPYTFDDVDGLLAAIEPVLDDAAIVVIERHVDSPEPVWPKGFEPTGQKLKKRTFGIARFDMAIYHRALETEPNGNASEEEE